jgi:NAD(P)-dependent dehydrogenase (short-subunit alcohol dehydrogenase family)
MSDLRFDERVAVVTGGGRGLGRAHALLLASRGAKIVVNDPGVSLAGDPLDAGPAQQVVDEIIATGGEAVASTASVATAEGGQEIIQTAIDAFGRIDILMHSAGIVRRSPLAQMTAKDFVQVLDVHLCGAFHVVQPAFARMCDAGYGRIVLTGSVVGLYGNTGAANYGAAKGGIHALSNSAAIEGASFNVKSNTVLPVAMTRMSEGLDTSAFPKMTPEMVSPLVGWLAHETCPISGEMLIAAAGRLARAYTVETPGVFRPAWTIEQVAEAAEAIRNSDAPIMINPAPGGFGEHLGYSFAMTKQG